MQETVENHLKSLLIKHFDPRKADSIFTEEGEVRRSILFLTRPRGAFPLGLEPLCSERSGEALPAPNPRPRWLQCGHWVLPEAGADMT